MIFQAVNRIIGSTNCFDIVQFHQSACRIFGLMEFFGTNIKYFTGRLRIKQFCYSESAFQFQVCPVIQWIAHGVGNRFCPFLKFFPVGSIFSGTITFVHAVGTHCTPFVMVAFEPYLTQIIEFPVIGYKFRVQMAMIIDDWLQFCMFMIQFLGCFGLQ